MWLVDLNNNFDYKWLTEPSDNKLSNNKLSENKLPDKNFGKWISGK